MPGPCLLRPTPNAFTYVASPGNLTLVVVSKVGTVTLDCVTTSVTDSAGKKPSDYNCAATQLSFALVSKMTYTAKIWFRFVDPGNDLGELKESCPTPALDDSVDVAFQPVYTFVVD
jgi:hypothetical protein